MGDQLKHKCILVQEWEGMEAIMETIRVLQSEGRISRAVSIKDPETESRQNAPQALPSVDQSSQRSL